MKSISAFQLDKERDYWIRGYIDRLVLVDQSVLEIHDYKTSGKLPAQKEVDSDRQLAFYQMGVGEVERGSGSEVDLALPCL